MVIDQKIKDLVKQIEQSNDHSELDNLIKELILRLRANLQNPQVAERYQNYRAQIGEVSPYPLDDNGFAQAFDPLEDEAGFWDAWAKYGIVVSKDVVTKEVCHHAIARMHQITKQISDGLCDLDNPETWNKTPLDPNGVSFISRGFFEVYHDDALAQIRQAIRLYIHHVLIWGQVELWTSYDRLGVKLPHHVESYGLPLHVDQNPLIHPDFKTVQGVLALADCPEERGTFVGVPGSRSVFAQYGRFAPDHGEFVELLSTDPMAEKLNQQAQAFPLRAGSIVSWDSRTSHANTENKSDDIRYVAYVAAGPAREDHPEFVQNRQEAFDTGIGSNVREALMHASKKSRYNNYEKLAETRKPEQLNLLGKLLYSQETYGKISE